MSNTNDIYHFIIQYKADNDGTSPTVREITAHCGISSTSITQYHITELYKHGLLTAVLSASGRRRGWRARGAEWHPPWPCPLCPEGECSP